ncbi:hypothetical protein C8U37_11346 [Trichococcus patagoniensis]|uniref:Uncharacterized protein n=1 Tax=Trichococcus patagoniensis TaxID=382641 RepID=A0A2T5III3_9LACT|nr:hypothetical protein C8U37_11346 [Trichococcus patagoniensis]
MGMALLLDSLPADRRRAVKSLLSSGEACVHRKTPVVSGAYSGEAALVGVGRIECGRTPAGPQLAGGWGKLRRMERASGRQTDSKFLADEKSCLKKRQLAFILFSVVISGTMV